MGFDSNMRCRGRGFDSASLVVIPGNFKVAMYLSMWELTFNELLARARESCDSFCAFLMDESIQCQQGAKVRTRDKDQKAESRETFKRGWF